MNYLIINQLGTPKSPNQSDVAEYLNEFLMDPEIIGVPRPIRDVLVKYFIVPRRSLKSSEKYKMIWFSEGSPLRVNTVELINKLQFELGNKWTVILSMRYGEPSIGSAIKEINFNLADVIYFLPLYPHSCSATVGSAINKFQEEISRRISFIKRTSDFEYNLSNNMIKIIPSFGESDWFISVLSNSISRNISYEDHLLLSYHGIPEYQERKEIISYRDQCHKTSISVQKVLNIPNDRISTGFQSRLGPIKWIGPNTEDVVVQLAKKGVRNLKVACPSFLSDCLETLDEINIELRETFLKNGGENFSLIPCLNADRDLVLGIANNLVKT